MPTTPRDPPLQMDVDRIRYTLADYHRARLSKIEKFAQFVVSDAEASQALSPKELVLVEKFLKLEEELFRTTLFQHLPEDLQSLQQESLGAVPGVSACQAQGVP